MIYIYICTCIYTYEYVYRLNDFLVGVQWGSRNFYSCNVQNLLFAVDEENMKLDGQFLYRKCFKEVWRAAVMSVVSLSFFPIRFLVAIPFYIFVIIHVRPTDIVAHRARRMLGVTMVMLPIFLGCCVAARIFLKAYSVPLLVSYDPAQAAKYMAFIHEVAGTVVQVELIAPFRALLILVVLEVIWKQRTDMAYAVDIVRNHILVDEACVRRKTMVIFGPVSAEVARTELSPWLLQKVGLDGASVTRLEQHKQVVVRQWHELQTGTGVISEVAHKHADMFFRSGMQDLLEQRIETVAELNESMQEVDDEKELCVAVPMDYPHLVEVYVYVYIYIYVYIYMYIIIYI